MKVQPKLIWVKMKTLVKWNLVVMNKLLHRYLREQTSKQKYLNICAPLWTSSNRTHFRCCSEFRSFMLTKALPEIYCCWINMAIYLFFFSANIAQELVQARTSISFSDFLVFSIFLLFFLPFIMDSSVNLLFSLTYNFF